MKSIITDDLEHCYICKDILHIEPKPKAEIHHIFRGTANRAKSEQYGLTIPICIEHHDDSNFSVEHNEELRDLTEEIAKNKFVEIYGEEKFLEEFKGRRFYKTFK